jgi:1-deoxy-D-xylulose 5-phosphate reductoisomerase
MWSPSKDPYKTPKDLSERLYHTEMRKHLGERCSNPHKNTTTENEMNNTTQQKHCYNGDSLSMYPTLHCAKKSFSKPSTMSFMKQGKEWTFSIYKDNELGFNDISNTIIVTVKSI